MDWVKPQDRHEDFVEAWLKDLKIGSVIHEPHGKTTFPDFIVANSILVECTLLQTKSLINGVNVVISEKENSYVRQFRKKDFTYTGPPICIYLSFLDPRLGKIDRKCLEVWLSAEERTVHQIKAPVHGIVINENLSIDVYPNTKSDGRQNTVKIGGYWCVGGDGWAMPRLTKSIDDAIKRKSEKLDGNWTGRKWLALQDIAFCDLEDDELKKISEGITKDNPWDEIFLFCGDMLPPVPLLGVQS